MPHTRRSTLSTGVIPFEEPGIDPHYAPDRRVRITHVDLTLRVHPEERWFEGAATLHFEPLARYEGRASFDLDEVDVVAVHAADGTPLRYRTDDGSIRIETDDHREVHIRWRGERPRHGLYFTGPRAWCPERGYMAWTQCQDEDAHFVLPCHDHPGSKWTWSIRIEAPNGYTTLSNGRELERGEEADWGWSTWEQTEPMPAYLFTAVAARLHRTDDRWRDRPVRYFVPEGAEEAVARTFGKTPAMIEHFSTITGYDYPWPRYDQVVVHDFIFGGMENIACTTIGAIWLVDAKAALEFDPETLVSHELAHQWFGDLVTCQDWSQGWLNESWATFMEAVWWEHDRSPAEAIWYRYQTMEQYFSEFNERYRRSLISYRFREPIDVFDRHLYQKGSCVLWTLRGILGERAFWAGTRAYLQQNAYRTVHTRDFQRAMEQTTGTNLDGFFHQWVEAPGHPDLQVQLEQRDDLLLVTVRQKQEGDGVPQSYRFPLRIEIITDGGTRAVSLPVQRREQVWALPVDGTVERVRIDPGLQVLATHAWSGPRSWWIRCLDDEDPVLVVRAAHTLLEEDHPEGRDAVHRCLGEHPFHGVRSWIAEQLGRCGGARARRLLVERLQEESDPRVRRAIASALGAFPHPDAATALLSVIDAPLITWQLTGAALEALGKTRDPRARATLVRHLDVPSWGDTLPCRALLGLGSTRDPAVLDPLLEASRLHRSDRVRAAAAQALGRLAPHLEAEPARRRVQERLIEMLQEPGFRPQLSAIQALGTCGDRDALGPLDRIHRSAPDGRTRRTAYEAALRIRQAPGERRAIETLRREMEALKEQNAKLLERLDKLERTEA